MGNFIAIAVSILLLILILIPIVKLVIRKKAIDSEFKPFDDMTRGVSPNMDSSSPITQTKEKVEQHTEDEYHKPMDIDLDEDSQHKK